MMEPPQLNQTEAVRQRHMVTLCGSLHVQSFANPLVWLPCYAELRGADLRIECIIEEGAGSFKTVTRKHMPECDRTVRLQPATVVRATAGHEVQSRHAAIEFLTEAEDPNDELAPLRLYADTKAQAQLWLDAFEAARMALRRALTVRLPLQRCRFLSDISQLPVDEKPPLLAADTLDLDTVGDPPTIALLPHGTSQHDSETPFEIGTWDLPQASLWCARRAFIFYWKRKRHGCNPLYVDCRFAEEDWPQAFRLINTQFERAHAPLRIDAHSQSAQAFFTRLDQELRAGRVE